MTWPLLLTLFAAPVSDYPAERIKAWEPEIASIEAKLKKNPPNPGSIFFVGSSSLRLWDTAKAFPDLPTANVAFGGSEMRDSVYFYDRILKPYTPSRVVIYAGDNDTANNRTPTMIRDDFTALAKLILAQHKDVKIDYIPIKPSPKRIKLLPVQTETNNLIREVMKGDARFTYLDIVPVMLDKDGQPKPELFLVDNLHMNAKGYALWKEVFLKAWK